MHPRKPSSGAAKGTIPHSWSSGADWIRITVLQQLDAFRDDVHLAPPRTAAHAELDVLVDAVFGAGLSSKVKTPTFHGASIQAG